MNKIFIYAGVRNHNSRTLEYTKRLLSIISNRNNVDISFRTPFNSELEISNSDSEHFEKIYWEKNHLFEANSLEEWFYAENAK